MNKLRIIILIGASISLLYSLVRTIVLRMPGRSRDSARKRMAQAQWLDADSREGTLVKITGKVHMRESGERFVSPLAESRCVALHMRALVRRGRSPRGELVEKLQIKPFAVEDDGSKVLVDATHALLDISPTPPPKTADVRKLFAEVGLTDANTTTSRCEETIVEVWRDGDGRRNAGDLAYDQDRRRRGESDRDSHGARPARCNEHAVSAGIGRPRCAYTLAVPREPTSRAAVLLCGVLVASLTGEAAAGDLAETARFLAGKPVASDAKLAEHARAESYTQYAEQIASGWKQFQQPNLERMRTWWTDRAPPKSSTVFYPFSGPDIGNALVLFPDADSYLMFGLEAPGAVPDLHAMEDEAISSGLNELKASLSTILQVNYFFTKAMEKKLGKGSFNSITGLLMFFLAMADCEVTGARTIGIARGGALVEGTTAGIPGIEIAFKRTGGKQQTIRYFMVNVADAYLAKSDFLPYLEHQGRFATMIKSASYLMHKEGIAEPVHFEQIRSLILTHSDFVVQDDSGVPLRLFARDTWKLRFHGQYKAPTPEFDKYLEPDLKIEMERNSTGKLPFSYGYAFKPGESNLMTAERAL